jgi:ribosomal protein S6
LVRISAVAQVHERLTQDASLRGEVPLWPLSLGLADFVAVAPLLSQYGVAHIPARSEARSELFYSLSAGYHTLDFDALCRWMFEQQLGTIASVLSTSTGQMLNHSSAAPARPRKLRAGNASRTATTPPKRRKKRLVRSPAVGQPRHAPQPWNLAAVHGVGTRPDELLRAHQLAELAQHNAHLTTEVSRLQREAHLAGAIRPSSTPEREAERIDEHAAQSPPSEADLSQVQLQQHLEIQRMREQMDTLLEMQSASKAFWDEQALRTSPPNADVVRELAHSPRPAAHANVLQRPPPGTGEAMSSGVAHLGAQGEHTVSSPAAMVREEEVRLLALQCDEAQRARDMALLERDAMRAERDAMRAERDAMRAGLDAMRAERDAMSLERDEAWRACKELGSEAEGSSAVMMSLVAAANERATFAETRQAELEAQLQRDARNITAAGNKLAQVDQEAPQVAQKRVPPLEVAALVKSVGAASGLIQASAPQPLAQHRRAYKRSSIKEEVHKVVDAKRLTPRMIPTPERTRAALIIQKYARGYVSRQEIFFLQQELEEEKGELVEERLHRYATLIERHFRGHTTRQEYLALQQLATVIEKYARGYIARQEYFYMLQQFEQEREEMLTERNLGGGAEWFYQTHRTAA